MKYLFSLLVIFYSYLFLFIASDDPCSGFIYPATAKSFGLIGGKCIFVSTSTLNPLSTCGHLGNTPFTTLSIDSNADNTLISKALVAAGVQNAAIGYTGKGDIWKWDNGDPTTYSNWKDNPNQVHTTPTPLRSTLPPANQRKSVAIVFAVDATLTSANAFTFAQLDLISELVDYMSARGPTEFAIFAYGCTKQDPFTIQYPYFESDYLKVQKMIEDLKNTILNDCIRVNPLDFPSMFNVQENLYYNRYTNSPRPFNSGYISMVYFSSTTNATNIGQARLLYPLSNSSVITVNVGNRSADVSSFTIPYRQNNIKVNSVEDIQNLLPTIDSIIYGSGSSSSSQNFVLNSNRVLATTDTICSFMNASDGFWYEDFECAKRNVLCQYFLPTPEPPPRENPRKDVVDLCDSEYTNYTMFDILDNDRCYKLSVQKKTFADSETTCITDDTLFLHTSKLASILTRDEQIQLDSFAVNQQPEEGMFWFGLKQDPKNTSNWIYINGDPNVLHTWQMIKNG
ncbi:unnamed protein product [Caenorhabditis angaria]|uniref:C-type lectin domain-containing protein n=1 Tax=Caenorhabditis angaria TaxID=860376 RepID=A0A9P1N4T1_9PELO|nr:unnamed protein product [Caenorhabditis angaria]